jgi:hypothetical protein
MPKNLLITSGVLGIIVSLGLAAPSPAAAQTVSAVKMVLSTAPSSTTVQNIDVAGLLPFNKVKRYTVTISPLPGVPVGVDRVRVMSCALDTAAASCIQVVAFDQDGATLTGRGAVLGPYVGTNSFVRIQRGADGVGNFDVRVNVYVELIP